MWVVRGVEQLRSECECVFVVDGVYESRVVYADRNSTEELKTVQENSKVGRKDCTHARPYVRGRVRLLRYRHRNNDCIAQE